MAAVRTTPLGRRSCPAIENVERVGRQHRDAIGGACRGGELLPVVVAPGDEIGMAHRPLQDDAMLGLGLRLGDRGIDNGLGDRPWLDAAGSRHDHARASGVDPGRQLMRREAAKDDRMDRTDARTGQHRHRRLGHHWHINQDAVALADAEPDQDAGEPRRCIAHFAMNVATCPVTGL